MKQIKTLTVNGETYEIHDPTAARDTIYVTNDISTGQCDYTAAEIYNFVKEGRDVVLLWNRSWCIPLTEAKTNKAYFDRTTFNERGDSVLVSLTIDSSGVLTNTGSTLVTQEQLAGMIDDSAIGTKAWSSKNTVDKLCPSFTESGAIVTCEPVEGYPLAVTSMADSTVTRCGKNLLPTGEDALQPVTYVNESGSLSPEFWGVELLLPPGTYTIRAIPVDTNTQQYIYARLCDPDKTTHLGNFHVVVGLNQPTNTFTLDRWAKLMVYAAGITIPNGQTRKNAAGIFARYHIQLEAGDTATDFAPYGGETFAPGQAVPALAGVNTLWASSGELTVTGRQCPW